MIRADTQYLQEAAIYPGHPITIAYLITQTYPSYEAAFVKDEKYGYQAALSDSAIPGAGGNVVAALEFLRYLREGVFKQLANRQGSKTWPVAVAWADDYWYHCDDQYKTDQERWKRGQDQADSLKKLLKKQHAWWKNNVAV